MRNLVYPMVVSHKNRKAMTLNDIDVTPLKDLYRIVGDSKDYNSGEKYKIIKALDGSEPMISVESSVFAKEFEFHTESDAEIEQINNIIFLELLKAAPTIDLIEWGGIYSRKLKLYFEKYNGEYRCMVIYHMDVFNLSRYLAMNPDFAKSCNDSLIDAANKLRKTGEFHWYLGEPPIDKCYAKGKTPYDALQRLRRNYEYLSCHILPRPEGLWDKTVWFDTKEAYKCVELIGLIDI